MQQHRMSILSLYEKSSLELMKDGMRKGVFSLYFVDFHSDQFDYRKNMFTQYLHNFRHLKKSGSSFKFRVKLVRI